MPLSESEELELLELENENAMALSKVGGVDGLKKKLKSEIFPGPKTGLIGHVEAALAKTMKPGGGILSPMGDVMQKAPQTGIAPIAGGVLGGMGAGITGAFLGAVAGKGLEQAATQAAGTAPMGTPSDNAFGMLSTGAGAAAGEGIGRGIVAGSGAAFDAAKPGLQKGLEAAMRAYPRLGRFAPTISKRLNEVLAAPSVEEASTAFAQRGIPGARDYYKNQVGNKIPSPQDFITDVAGRIKAGQPVPIEEAVAAREMASKALRRNEFSLQRDQISPNLEFVDEFIEATAPGSAAMRDIYHLARTKEALFNLMPRNNNGTPDALRSFLAIAFNPVVAVGQAPAAWGTALMAGNMASKVGPAVAPALNIVGQRKAQTP